MAAKRGSGLLRTSLDSPLGPLALIAGDQGLRAVLWPRDRASRVRRSLGGLSRIEDVPLVDLEASDCSGFAAECLSQTCEQLSEYFAGTRKQFELQLDARGTEFQTAAWSALSDIPYGDLISYAQQATAMGDVKLARAVGAANGANPISIVIGCHRVVASDGGLGGFAGGLRAKAWLQAHERAHNS